MYFAHGIGGWCGSVLIDEPLFIYRIYGSNIYSQRAQLHRSLPYQPGASGDSNDKAKAFVIDQLIGRCDRFTQNLLFKLNLVALLFRLNGAEADANLPRWARAISAAHRLVLHFDAFAAQFGTPATKLVMILSGVPWPLVWRAGRGSLN